MNKIIYPAAQWINTSSSQQLCILVPSDKIDLTQYMLRGFRERGIKYLYVMISRPRKPRTTGDFSQNHAINGYCQQIAITTGNSFTAVKERMKVLAIGRNYPIETLPDGSVMPRSEVEIDTIEAGYLIDTILQFAAEWDIRLIEGDE